MKHSAESQLPSLGRRRLDIQRWMLPLLVVILGLADATASSAGLNPYTGIVERNSFGLRPPVNPADLVKPPPPLVADIKLQGITTILGRKQVLMKVRLPARPPEPARDQSVVLSEGQREGEVEILEINPEEGTVKVNNAGTILPLNMKDHGEKPTPGAAVPTVPGVAHPGGIPPGVPPPPSAAIPPAAASGLPGTTVETFGGNKTIPTRALRSGTEASSGLGGGAAQVPQLNAETAAALYIVNHAKNEQLRQSGVPLPKMPQHPLFQGLSGDSGSKGQ